VGVLALWSLVPLALAVAYSLQRYNLLVPDRRRFNKFGHFTTLFQDPAFWTSLVNTGVLVGSVVALTIAAGLVAAAVFDEPFPGRRVARLLVIAPFFVMPAVAALVWKNLLLHPVNGLFAALSRAVGMVPIDVFTDAPMAAIVLIVAWQWTPFAALVFLTAMQSIDPYTREAALLDGASWLDRYRHIVLPHLGRPIGVVVMVESILLLSVFAEIQVTTGGGPGLATTNLAYLIYLKALIQYDVGQASAVGLMAIVFANLVAMILIRAVARNLHA
jgi:sorbitol/mannitol transport system permease protein